MSDQYSTPAHAAPTADQPPAPKKRALDCTPDELVNIITSKPSVRRKLF